MKIVSKNGAISRKDFSKVREAMDVLGSCVYRNPTAGYISENGDDMVYIDLLNSPEEVSEAIEAISSLFG